MKSADVEPTPKQPSLLVTAALVGIPLLLTLTLIGQLLVVVPAFERRFEDFRMRLPVVTEITIASSRFAVKYWLLLPPCILLAFAAAGWVSYLIRHRSGKRWLSALWFLLLTGVPMVANAMLWAALWMPMRQLEEGLRK